MTPYEITLARVRALSEHRFTREPFPRLRVPCFMAKWNGRRWVTRDDTARERKATRERRSSYFLMELGQGRFKKNVKIDTARL